MTVFRVDIPLHEVAANSRADIVASLRYVASQLEARAEEAAFRQFELDQSTVQSLAYISYGITEESVSCS